MKIAVSGKGGTGKTTISALLCLALEAEGRNVIAVDADSNPTLAHALGRADAEAIMPLTQMDGLIREKTGAEKGRYGAYFRMNPDVSDIPERFQAVEGKVRLLTMGPVDQGGGGCACPGFVLVKALVSHLFLNAEEDMVVDMEAGVEHLGRGVAEKVDALLVVVRPDRASCLTAGRIRKLAGQIGIRNLYAIGNAIRGSEEREFLEKRVPGFEFLAFLPFCEEAAGYERQGKACFGLAEMREGILPVVERIKRGMS